MLKIKIITLSVVFLPLQIWASPIYQCEDGSGHTQYQELPCQGNTVKVINDIEEKHTVLFTEAMKQTLSKLTQKSTAAYNDSKKIKAMEVLAKVDAAKSYAFTQIYAVSEKYCEANIGDQLINYKNHASNVIALGSYYYSQGIDAHIDGKDFSQSGKELHAALDEMIVKLDQEHQQASDAQLFKKCNDASQALTTLTMLYAD